MIAEQGEPAVIGNISKTSSPSFVDKSGGSGIVGEGGKDGDELDKEDPGDRSDDNKSTAI